MESTLSLNTPALLFPAISLLFLAYTSRFLALAQLIRQLHSANRTEAHPLLAGQIANLRKRIGLIRLMQLLGVVGFVACSLSMIALFLGAEGMGKALFGASLATLTASLVVSLYEIWISTGALELALADLER